MLKTETGFVFSLRQLTLSVCPAVCSQTHTCGSVTHTVCFHVPLMQPSGGGLLKVRLKFAVVRSEATRRGMGEVDVGRKGVCVCVLHPKQSVEVKGESSRWRLLL